MQNRPRPFALIILDGWGYREEQEANAIAKAHKPCWDFLWENYAHTLISGSGRCVGLPDGQMGNSEVGHLNMGAGRIVHQDLTRIDQAVADQSFFVNPVLTQAVDQAIQANKAIHIMGLLSSGGVHSHEQHIQAMLKLAAQRGTKSIYIHAFLDGRDTPPKSAASSLIALDQLCQTLQCGQIVSLIGRYYAMDRDQRWDRVKTAYDLIVTGQAQYTAPNVQIGLQQAYDRGETDEFVKATQIGATAININAGDTVIFMNFRADRARELTRAFIDPHFQEFARTHAPQVQFISLTEYDATFQIPVAFATEPLQNILGEYFSHLGLQQLRIAETEKYAHVTFFFNGGVEQAYPGEERILIPSPKVATYDLQPEMSAFELTDRLVTAIRSQKYDVIICNFANPDMVGHTGNLAATIKAIETIDTCLGKIITALQATGGEAIITADHGNAEMLFDPQTQQPHTAHTHEPVPLIYFGRKAINVKENGKLSDVAPTLLYLMNLPQPKEMTGQSLLKLS
jgi:2,3-bisphosphoglycerate-independent phosphoglycerate mutase